VNTLIEQDLAAVFGASGPLAECLTGFRPRPEQLAMAQDVSRALTDGSNLVVEAGTGTGKTLAYLLPAIDSGLRVIISTGTRTLQDQLFHRDLPMIGAAIGRPIDAQLLKGRSNYLCLYRLERARESGDAGSRKEARELAFVQNWAARTTSGDISEVIEVAEDSSIWSKVTSTVDNCLGSRCPVFDDCHVVAARHAAREAELVVVNHHLLMADLTMRDEGFGQLLPGADAIVVDEAHHFPEVAQSFFNVAMGGAQLAELCRDVRTEAIGAGQFDREIEQAVDGLSKEVADARLCLREGIANIAWDEVSTAFTSCFSAIGERLDDLIENLTPLEELSPGLKRCKQRALSMYGAFESISDADVETGLRWLRLTTRSFTANVTPLDTSAELAALLESHPASWIFTSATLAVRDDFSHFINRLGLQGLTTRQIPSPFAYERIARLYLPGGLPLPHEPVYNERVVAEMKKAALASQGRAFLLFTSHRALRQAADILEADPDFDFPLLIQGVEPRSRLLEQFSERPNSVLLGTSTFWEGVDIRGHDLVLVAIDKLPFAAPGDPMLSARLAAIESQGGNPFRDYQLPQAVLSLKQGVGRLIRDYDDYGVVMICDPRLTQKSYGRVFLASLPSLPVVRDLEVIRAFFEAHGANE